jgi:hypothetical protein
LTPLWHHRERNTVQHAASQRKEIGSGMGFCTPLHTPATPELSLVMRL